MCLSCWCTAVAAPEQARHWGAQATVYVYELVASEVKVEKIEFVKAAA